VGVALRAALGALLFVTAARVSGIDTQTAPRTTRDRVYSSEQAARGAAQFATVCASCHDPAKVPAGKKPAPPLVGAKFLDTWSNRTLGELLTNIQTTMPNDGSAVLTEAQTADLVAHILEANGFPDGPAPLKYDAAAKSIVIVK
jgi:mono/diheme cytochrome c family protein